MQPSRHQQPYVWMPEIVDRIAQFLDANVISCTLRPINKITAQQFANRTVVRLSQPVPHHAFRDKWDNDQSMRTYNLTQRRKFVALTATSGYLPNLELAVQRARIDLTYSNYSDDPLSAAAAAGHIHICEWLKQRGYPMDSRDNSPLVAASRAGRQEVCTWLLNNGCPWNFSAVCSAARSGHAALTDWLLARKPHHVLMDHTDHKHLMQSAAEGCDLATLQGLYLAWQAQLSLEHGPNAQVTPIFYTLAAAASSTTPDWWNKLMWLEAQPGLNVRHKSVCLAAARCPDARKRLTWLRKRRYPVDMEVVMEAAQVGNLGVMKMLLKDRIKQDVNHTACKVAWAGQLAALKLLHDRRCWLGQPKEILKAALRNGQLEVVDWLVTKVGLGVALEKLLEEDGFDLVNQAAKAGCRVMLEWLHERGCRGYEEVFYYAAAGGCEEVVEWLLAHGYKIPSKDACLVYFPACCEGDLATLDCLHRLGCEWVDNLEVADAPFSPGVCAWLTEMGYDYCVIP